MIRIRLSILVLAALALLAAPAAAATPTQILRDCVLDGVLDGTYTAKELRDARAALPADAAEYSDCGDILRDAALNAAAGRGNGGGGDTGGNRGAGGGVTDGPPAAGGTTGLDPTGTAGDPGIVSVGDRPATLTPSSPEEQALVDAARRGSAGPVKVGDQAVTAGIPSLASALNRRSLPAALVLAIAALAAGSLALVVLLARDRFRSPVFRRR